MDSDHLIIRDMLTICFRFSIRRMRQNYFSLILIRDTIKETLKHKSFPPFLLTKLQSLIVVVISLIQNLIKHVFVNFHTLNNIESKFRKSFRNIQTTLQRC